MSMPGWVFRATGLWTPSDQERILALTLDPSGIYVTTAEAVGDEDLEVDQPFPMRITPAALFR